MQHHRTPDSSMGRRTYLALTSAAVVGAVGVGSIPTTADDDPAPDDTDVGGGDGYDDAVSSEDADIVVSTREELLSALEDANDGETIYVDDDAEIDLSASRITIPGGVTLASGRGRDGSSGALITADERALRLFQIFEEGVRVTGLRLRGHQVGYYDPDGSAWSNDSLAIRAYADCEIDNCELYGWTHAGIGIGQNGPDPIDSAAHVHHCSIHDNMMEGLGYGIVVYRGDPLIEYNYFDENRHSIAGGGQAGCSYEARYNVQGPTNLLFGFEMHSPGGERIDIHHNTFELVERRDGRPTPAVAIRGTPSDGATIESNWFFNATDPGEERYLDGSPIVQYDNDDGGSDWDNVLLSNNHFGTEEPDPEIGHPRGGPETAQLRVYVREEGEEDHLDGATVEIEPHEDTDMSGYDGSLTAETEDGEEYSGSYALFEELPVGFYDIFVTHPEYEDGALEDLELGTSGRQPPISLEPRDRDVITISGRGETAHYEFTADLADGTSVEKSTEYGGTINDYDVIDGSTVTGRTTREPDSFAFIGEITDFDADAPVDVLLNGEEADFAPEEPANPIPDGQIITLEGGSESDPTNYLFGVTDRIEQSDANDATIDDEDAIVGTTVAGILSGERDSYVIPVDDEITGFVALGDITVWIDDTELAANEVLPYFE